MKSLLVKFFPLIWDLLIYPTALEYVKKTSNTYDDTALKFLDELEKEILAHLPTK